MTVAQTEAVPGRAGISGLWNRLPGRAELEIGWRAVTCPTGSRLEPSQIAIQPVGDRLSLVGPDGEALAGITSPRKVLEASAEVDLLLPRGEHLPLSFRLPNASLTEIEEMVETELATSTPFPVEDSLWFWEARQGDGEWAIDATIVLAEAMRPAIGALAASGARLGTVRRAPGDGPSLVGRPAWALGADEPSRSYPVPRSLRLPMIGLGIFCALAAIALLTGEFGRASLAERAVEARDGMVVLRADAMRDRTLRTAAERSTFRASLPLHAAALLPDGTWLERLSITEDEAVLSGFSPSAAATSDLLAATNLLQGVEFGAPVTRDNSQGIERFRLDGSFPWR